MAARTCFLPALLAAALALSGTAQAQRVIVNPSFEANDPQGAGAANYEIYANGSVSGWDSASGEIELWDTNFQGVPAYDGSVFAEMNANVPGAFYQNICMVTGESIGWTFAHRARTGGPATQTARFQIANSSGTQLQLLTAPAGTQATAGSVIVTDALPANLALFVGTHAPGPGPLAFAAGSSGLTYTYASLPSTTDDLSFSNNNGTSYTYTPAANANGVDPAVTHIRINPKGSMAPGSSFTINLRAMVE